MTNPLPDPRGRFGEYGGRYVPETLVPALEELEAAWRAAREDPAFQAELEELLTRFAGRETPLGEARRMSADAGGCRVLLKREDLNHTGAHKVNNTLGQVLLARRMGKTPHHRRDRRRAARRRHRHRRGAVRPALRRLHGRARRRAAGAERLPHAAARRARRPGRVRLRAPSRTP